MSKTIQLAKRSTSTGYATEIEARRAEYERLAESLATMQEFELGLRPAMLDVGTEGDEGHYLGNAVADHIGALSAEMDMMAPETIRKFYAEMRLWADQRTLDSLLHAPKESQPDKKAA
jgi:hypothetical protein